MSRFRSKRHLLASAGRGGGGGGGGTVSTALIGMNPNVQSYEYNSKFYANYWHYADGYEYQDSAGNWGPLPDSYLTTVDGWPNSAPSVDPSGKYTFRKLFTPSPTANTTLNVTWTGNFASCGTGGPASGYTSTGAHSATFVNTLGMSTNDSSPPGGGSAPTPAYFWYQITPGDGSYGKNIFIAAPGITFAEPTYVSDVGAMTSGPIRMLNPSNVNGNLGIDPSAPGQLGNSTCFPAARVTAANRNTPNGGNWVPDSPGNAYNGTPHGHDGWPIEVQFGIARALNRDLWTCLQANGDNTYYDYIATWIRDYETTIQPGQTTTQPWPTGGKIYLQLANETWNSAFPYYHQADQEGLRRNAGQTISSITHSGNTATVTTATAHGLANTDRVTVDNALPATLTGQTISSITISGTTATVTTAAPHGLATNNAVTVTGAVPSGYNGYVSSITVTGTTTFTYTVPDGTNIPGSNATTVGSYSAQLYNVTDRPVTVINSTSFSYVMDAPPPTNATTVGVYATSIHKTDGSGAADGEAARYRTAQRSAEVFARFESILNAAGKMNRIVRIFDFQLGNTGTNNSNVDDMMNWNTGVTSPITGGALGSDHCDMITQSAYFDASNSDPTNLTQAFTDLANNIDTVIGLWTSFKAKATSYGKKVGAYEGGNGTGDKAWASNRAQLRAFRADSRMQTWVAYFLQQWAGKIGSDAPMCWYADYQFEGGGECWNTKDYQGAPESPTSQALKNFQSNILLLFDLNYGTLSTRIGQPNGTLIGSVPARGTALDTVYSLSVNPSNAFAINSTTGQISIADTTQLAGLGGTASVTVVQTNPLATNSPKSTATSIAINPAFDAFSWSSTDVLNGTLSNNNLTVAFAGAGPNSARTTNGLSSGKWYWEVHADNNASGNLMIGAADGTLSKSAWWYSTGGTHAAMAYGGNVDYNGGAAGSIGGLATNDVVQIAYDADNKVIYLGRNGTWGLGNPATLTGGLTMGVTNPVYPAAQGDNATAVTIRPTVASQTYAAPTGFTALG